MDNSEMQIAAEAILFASGEPVHISRLCMALDTDRPRAEEALRRLGDHYAFERRGIRLVCMEDSYQLCSAPEYAEVIRKAFEIRKTAKLSQPALEVLAIVAYYQPVTRAQVDQIRGVDSAYTIGLLLDRGLIEECGQLQAPGRPRLYRTTQGFLWPSTSPLWRSCPRCRGWRRAVRCAWTAPPARRRRSGGKHSGAQRRRERGERR